jgi:hypothetical protein
MESIGGLIFYKDLRDTCVFNDLDPIQCENLKFCFMDFIQTELDRIEHEIRQQTSSSVISGKPDTMFLSGLYETHDFGNAVNFRDVHICKEHVFTPNKTMRGIRRISTPSEPDLLMPLDPDLALQLCTELNDLILRIDLI